MINADDVLFVHQQKLIDFQLKNKNILFILDEFKNENIFIFLMVLYLRLNMENCGRISISIGEINERMERNMVM